MSDDRAFLAAAYGVHICGAGTKEASNFTAPDNLLDADTVASNSAT